MLYSIILLYTYITQECTSEPAELFGKIEEEKYVYFVLSISVVS